MPTYVVYDRNDGRVLHTHREYLMAAEETSELKEADVLELVADSLPEGCESAITRVEELTPRVGYRHYVDLQSLELMQVESPPREGAPE